MNVNVNVSVKVRVVVVVALDELDEILHHACLFIECF